MFEAEGGLIADYHAARAELLAARARLGRSVPAVVARRVNFTIIYAGHPAEADLPHAELLRLADEVATSPREFEPARADVADGPSIAPVSLPEPVAPAPRFALDDLHRAMQDHAHHGLATLDTITVGMGAAVPVTGLSCKVISGRTPTACPDADPPLPPSVLPSAERAVLRFAHLPDEATVHWVGHAAGYQGRCRCHPDAPFAAPFDRGRWAAVVGGLPSDNPTSDENLPPHSPASGGGDAGEPPPPDRVHLPTTLINQGNRADVEVAAVLLLKHMMENRPRAESGRPESELLRELYDNAPDTLKSHCHKANKGLKIVGHPDRLSRVQVPGYGAHILWVPAHRFRNRGGRNKSEGNSDGTR